MITVLLLVGFVVAVLLFYRNEFKKYNRHLDKMPGLAYIPILGSTLALCKREDLLDKLMEHSRTYKGSFLARIGPIQPVVFVSDSKTLEFMLKSTKYIDKSIEYKFISNWLGNGLLTSTGSHWRKHRKIITPAFHFSILESFIPTFEAQTKTLVAKLKKEVNGSSFDIFPYITMCSLDIITETSMGACVNAQDTSSHTSSHYVKALREVIGTVITRTFSVFLTYDIFYKWTSTYKIEKQGIKTLRNYSRQVVQNRKRMLEGMELKPVDEFGNKVRYALLDLLLSKGSDGEQVLSEAEILDEVETLLFEGHDTTSSAVVFALYNIARYQEVQQRLLEEFEEVYKDDFLRDTTYDDLPKLSYLEMVIKESLRLFPSVPIYGRQLQEDVEIDGKIYPKGCRFTFFIYALHRDPRNFPDPDKFDPSRFSKNDIKPYTYLPFSAGSRNCIGQKFAMDDMKTMISRLLRQYEFKEAVPKRECKLEWDGLLKSATGAHVRIKERKYKLN